MRNRPRPHLAWLLLAILLGLLVLAIRVEAAPAGDPIAEAVRYANALTGVEPDAELARRDPDDPDDQIAGSASDDDDDGDGDGDDGDGGDDAGAERARGEGPRGEGPRGEGPRGDREQASNPSHEEEPALDVALAEHAGELALLDDAAVGSTAITSDDAGLAASSAAATETYEARMRGQRSWILGRVDVGLAWRRRISEPMHAPARVDDQIWLLATWRR